MQLSLQTDYALRTLMFLATRPGRARVGDVAEFYGISSANVAKVVNQLSRLGYLRSIRGVGGGIELGREIEEISVGAVISALEGDRHLLDCVGTNDVCVIQQQCKLLNVLARAEQIQADYLNGVMLSDVLPTRALA